MLSSAIYSDGFIGHDAVIRRLQALLEGERLPHAVLFSGPDGVGKLLAARWLAAAYLCPKNGCGHCSTCARVLKGFHPDLHIVLAEEGRRDILIGQVRELTTSVATRPFEASGKAAIIDEANRMNEESQNAFLKTLEEPPPGSLIILVTAAADRLLPTIRSRCQRFLFSRLTEEEMCRFVSCRSQLEPDFPERLAGGSPGRLFKLVASDAGTARRIFIDFMASRAMPSPVQAAAELMQWAESKGGLKQHVRELLQQALSLGVGLLRDTAMLVGGAPLAHLLNKDLEGELRDAAGLYAPAGLFYCVRQIVEAVEDIGGYVDPGLAVENIFRVIRDARKRG
jgi:DNA polymerase-3 subunit delta'